MCNRIPTDTQVVNKLRDLYITSSLENNQSLNVDTGVKFVLEAMHLRSTSSKNAEKELNKYILKNNLPFTSVQVLQITHEDSNKVKRAKNALKRLMKYLN